MYHPMSNYESLRLARVREHNWEAKNHDKNRILAQNPSQLIKQSPQAGPVEKKENTESNHLRKTARLAS